MATTARGKGVSRLLLFVLVALPCPWSSGCSYLFVTEAPRDHERLRYFECTTSEVAPVLDAALVAGMTLGAGSIVVDPEPGDDSIDTSVRVGIALGLAALAAVSAADGFHETARCRRAKHALHERMSRGQDVQATLGCASDIECKGERICVDGRCADPPASAAPDVAVPVPAAPDAGPAAPATLEGGESVPPATPGAAPTAADAGVQPGASPRPGGAGSVPPRPAAPSDSAADERATDPPPGRPPSP